MQKVNQLRNSWCIQKSLSRKEYRIPHADILQVGPAYIELDAFEKISNIELKWTYILNNPTTEIFIFF